MLISLRANCRQRSHLRQRERGTREWRPCQVSEVI